MKCDGALVQQSLKKPNLIENEIVFWYCITFWNENFLHKKSSEKHILLVQITAEILVIVYFRCLKHSCMMKKPTGCVNTFIYSAPVGGIWKW